MCRCRCRMLSAPPLSRRWRKLAEIRDALPLFTGAAMGGRLRAGNVMGMQEQNNMAHNGTQDRAKMVAYKQAKKVAYSRRPF